MDEQKLTGYPSIDKPWLKYYNKELISGEIPQVRVYDYMFSKNREFPNDVALNYFGRKISYSSLFENIDKAAKSFKALGVNEGDIVTLCMPSLPETIYSFYALNRIGAIANLIDPRYNPEKIQKLINTAKSDILLFVDVVEAKIDIIADSICSTKIICVSPASSFPSMLKTLYLVQDRISKKHNKSFMTWNTFIEAGANFDSDYDCRYKPDSPVAIVYTGGTTGTPKGAIMTTLGINTIVYHQKSCMPLVKRQSRYLDIMPPFIAFGLTCGMNNPLCEGAELDLIPTFNHHKFDQLILKHRPNHVIGVPSFWEDLSNSKKVKNRDLSFLQSIIAGGDGMNAASEVKVNDFLKNHNCLEPLLKGYGLTEVSSCATFTCTHSSNKIGSVGIPLAKNNIKVVDPNTNRELKYNEQGEIYIQTSSIFGGYFNLETETQENVVIDNEGKQWVRTYDIGYVDEDGCLFIVDRMRNMIIRSDGFKVFPQVIENCIMAHPAVEACKVIGIKDPAFPRGMLPKAFIVISKDKRDNSDTILNEIQDICNTHLPEYQIPVGYVSKDELPLTSIGKIDLQALEGETAQ